MARYNVVATLAVGEDGALTLLQNLPCGGSMPWGCVLGAASGARVDSVMLVQNQYSRWEGNGGGGVGEGQLAIFRRDAVDGQLRPAGTSAEIEDLMCVAIAKL
jgi:hypothetical protein